MSAFDLCIFDLDGTLLDSIEDIAHSYRLCCQEFGYPEPPTLEVTSWVGQGHEVAVNECYAWLLRTLKDQGVDAFPKFNKFTAEEKAQAKKYAEGFFAVFVQPERDAFRDRHKVLYIEVGNTFMKVYPGVANSLAALKAQGVKLAVLTNKMRSLAPKVLKDAKLWDYFDAVYCDGDLENNKPHPEGILKHAANFGVALEKTLMVGDSNNDIRAGLAAPCPTLGLTYGYNYGVPIANANPTYVSDHFGAVVLLAQGVTDLTTPEAKEAMLALEK